jgi:pyruvate formate lyase activating enzyme
MDELKIAGIEKFSMVDYGEKIALTVFLEACNMRCPFCHNAALLFPDSNNPGIPHSEILGYLTKRKGILDGVCVTGGEPTLHKELPAFLEKVKALGYPVKLDTNGTNPGAVKNLYQRGLIDYVAMDIKNSPAKYALTAGIPAPDLVAVKETASFLMSSGIGYEFRTTLINEFHEESDMLEIGKWLEGAKLYYLQKFVPSGNCLTQGLPEAPIEKALHFKRLLSGYIDTVNLRGY